jgi:hypothetical protein
VLPASFALRAAATTSETFIWGEGGGEGGG